MGSESQRRRGGERGRAAGEGAGAEQVGAVVERNGPGRRPQAGRDRRHGRQVNVTAWPYNGSTAEATTDVVVVAGLTVSVRGAEVLGAVAGITRSTIAVSDSDHDRANPCQRGHAAAVDGDRVSVIEPS